MTSPSERDKMLAGALYNAADPELQALRLRARSLCRQFNSADAAAEAERLALLQQLFGQAVDTHIEPPFFCDYGLHISLGEQVFFNANCVVLDVARVHIGSRTLFGPAVQIYAATHPMTVAERRTGLELGKPVTVGADVWVGGASVICPGVHIGDGSVIGAGSVVTRSVPAGVFAAGNPCRVVRAL